MQVPCNEIKWNAQSSNHAIKHVVVDSNENEIKEFLKTLLDQGCHAGNLKNPTPTSLPPLAKQP